MRKFLLIISLFVFCTSCFIHKGQMANGQCRPKSPDFTVLKSPFKETDKLVYNKIYLSDSNIKSYGIGFYQDGRLIYLVSKGNNDLDQKDVYDRNWNNSMYIGYWRVENDKIKIEYFVCGNSGVYIRKQGEIKGDTIIFERDCGTSNPFKTVKCPDKYILSDMSFE